MTTRLHIELEQYCEPELRQILGRRSVVLSYRYTVAEFRGDTCALGNQAKRMAKTGKSMGKMISNNGQKNATAAGQRVADDGRLV